MQHSSQITKDEYGNKHEPEITKKLANEWEKKIGSDTVHNGKLGSAGKKGSPTTVLNSSKASAGKRVELTPAGTAQASKQGQSANTKEIVKNFERMASNAASDTKEAEGSVQKLVKKMSSLASARSTETVMPKSTDAQTAGSGSVTKEELYDVLAKMNASVSDMNIAVKNLKSKVDKL